MNARKLLLTLSLAAAVAQGTAAANHATDNTIYDEGTTFLLSRSLSGGVPNGSSPTSQRNIYLRYDGPFTTEGKAE